MENSVVLYEIFFEVEMPAILIIIVQEYEENMNNAYNSKYCGVFINFAILSVILENMGTKKLKILVVDDEPLLLEGITNFLIKHGYDVDTATTGTEALVCFRAGMPDIILLDLMLPDISGEDVCREIRNESRVPILMLTAKSSEQNVVAGLGLGADDYMRKPFGLSEMLARIETVLRRTRNEIYPAQAVLKFGDGDLSLDFERNDFRKRGEAVRLTPTERRMLALMIKYPGRVFTRDELIDAVFGDQFDGYDRSVDAHIKNLRRKIETNTKRPAYIATVHGVGYKFEGERD